MRAATPRPRALAGAAMSSVGLAQRIEWIESGYEYLLAYAAQGRRDEGGSKFGARSGRCSRRSTDSAKKYRKFRRRQPRHGWSRLFRGSWPRRSHCARCDRPDPQPPGDSFAAHRQPQRLGSISSAVLTDLFLIDHGTESGLKAAHLGARSSVIERSGDDGVNRCLQPIRVRWMGARGVRYDAAWSRLTRLFVPPLLDALRLRPGAWLLDVACGPGYLAEAARRRGAMAIGVDFSPTMVAIAARSNPKLQFHTGDRSGTAIREPIVRCGGDELRRLASGRTGACVCRGRTCAATAWPLCLHTVGGPEQSLA